MVSFTLYVLIDGNTGEGTFGVVLLAKAEGILKEFPERNFVAVKTNKGMST